MTNKEIKISYIEYNSLEEMETADRELAEAAIAMTGNSYSPYSHFSVGAAVRLDDGTIVKGSNQENAAYPSGLCAERTAMFWANANYPDKAMVSIAVAAAQNGQVCKEPATPCAACRQVMVQYQRKGGVPMSVLIVGDGKIWKFHSVDDILPLAFKNI
ncbi:MAG: cytidine deaminase [Candidatus Cryptobacteroides sp.]